MQTEQHSEPTVNVGIKTAQQVEFTLQGGHKVDGSEAEGQYVASVEDGKVIVEGIGKGERLSFIPTSEHSRITVSDVTIGVNFHWERNEMQQFGGTLHLVADEGRVTVINELPVEDYLKSVISSEMSATASLELLKAHAVISRSWLLAQIEKRNSISAEGEQFCACTDTPDEIVRWWDREDHTLFDVCADDHCQRYQGLTRQTTPLVEKAVNATRGEVLVADGGQLCDARFSKCCGGVFEQFENCWEPLHKSYLVPQRDAVAEHDFPDLTVEANAREWILTNPPAFCGTTDKRVLSQVLNSYDQETPDFYRWTETLSAERIAGLLKAKTGIDFGRVTALEPLQRGSSGRIIRLRIVGTKATKIFGKELEIRRILSDSHLYSSAFVVIPGKPDSDGIPTEFTLKGAGWGHGVGLCQIGAAVMGSLGYTYRCILLHYFIGADIKALY